VRLAWLMAVTLAANAAAGVAEDSRTAATADAVLLAYRPAEGREAKYIVRLEGEVKQHDRTTPLKAAFLFVARIVETDDDDGTVGQRVLFGPGRVRLGGRRLPWSLGGRAYRVVRDRSGRIVEVPSLGPSPSQAQGDFAAVFHDLIFASIFPDEAVRVGDEWTRELHDEAIIFEPDPAELEDRTVTGRYQGRLADIQELTGARAAVVESASEVRVVSRAAEVTAKWTATVTVDPTDGWPVCAEGVVESLRIQPAGGVALEFENLTIRITPYVPENAEPDDPSRDEEEEAWE